VKDSTSKNGIGICNVYQRIKLYYGNEFGIDITSQFGVGTKVYVYLPENGSSKE
jgi:two-component system sensor histidine kinase YesM